MTTDFAGAISQATLQGRGLAESLMLDTCTITRKASGTGDWNEGTGQYDPPTDEVIYTGRCRIQIKSIVASSTATVAGERNVINQDLELQLPINGTDAVAIGDVAMMLTAANDPSLVGRAFTVRSRHEKSLATARRLRVTEGTA